MTQFAVTRRMMLVMLSSMVLAVPVAAQSGGGAARGELTLGRQDAPVTVIEYASMTCPHCAQFHNTTFKDLKTKYIDTGKVYFVYREFPLDRLAFAASLAARCVGEKRFFAMLALLFEQQPSWARNKKPVAALARLAKLGGVGQERFDACLKDRKLGEVVLANRMTGEKQHKVNSTPSFVVNGEKMEGYYNMAGFDKILGQHLQK